MISDQYYYQYLSDNTCCKPRNLVSRLNIIRSKYPNRTAISKEMIDETEAEYSARVWKEVEYLLGTSFSGLAILGLKRALFSGTARIKLRYLEEKIDNLVRVYPREMAAIKKEGLVAALNRLFEYGAIGNVYYSNESARTIYAWSFRGEDVFQPDRAMEVQRSLWKHLSIVRIGASAAELRE